MGGEGSDSTSSSLEMTSAAKETDFEERGLLMEASRGGLDDVIGAGLAAERSIISGTRLDEAPIGSGIPGLGFLRYGSGFRTVEGGAEDRVFEPLLLEGCCRRSSSASSASS